METKQIMFLLTITILAKNSKIPVRVIITPFIFFQCWALIMATIRRKIAKTKWRRLHLTDNRAVDVRISANPVG